MRKFLVYQITSRRNYDVASIINNNNQLSKLVTDFYNLPDTFFNKFMSRVNPKFNTSFSKYSNNSIPDKLVKRNLFAGLIYRIFLKYFNKNKHHLGIRISSKILYFSVKNIQNYDAIYGYDTCSLEIFKRNFNHKFLVLEQCVAPRNSQVEMYEILQKKYQVNFGDHILNCKKFKLVEEKEWEFANKIICPSSYVKQELIKQGLNPSKIEVIPYGFTNSVEKQKINYKIENCTQRNNLNVLFVGNEALRKGVLDIIEVANKLILNTEISFHIVGKIKEELHEFNISVFPDNVKFHGKLSKNQLEVLYLQSDLFFLPSYLEGSALVIYEALSFGIPTLTTYESGSVVDNNVDGFIVKVGDVKNMVNKINELFYNRELLKKMSFAALEKSVLHTINEYNLRLINSVNK